MSLQSVGGNPVQPAFGSAGGANGDGVTFAAGHFHAQSIETCLKLLSTTLQGLSEQEAATRGKAAQRTGKSGRHCAPARQIFLKSIKNAIALLFLAAAGLSLLMGKPVDAGMIVLALLGNGLLQALIQWKVLGKAEAQAAPEEIRCTVKRGGQSLVLKAHQLVVGDVLTLSAGQILPADVRLISAKQLQADESLLTGESVLVPKNAQQVLHPMEDVTAQSNMLFAGTVIKTGQGEAVVTALGEDTVMGKIAALAQNTEKRESPFTRRLNALSFKIFLAVGVLIALVVGVGLFQKKDPLLLAQLGLMMGIAAFPETIPGLASLIISLGIGRLREKKVLVKSFQALETVGDIQTLCTDKTGTLTENYLVFDQVFLPDVGAISYDPQWQSGDLSALPYHSLEAFLRIGRLNNGTMVEGLRSGLMGDPIDVAIYRAAPAALEAGYHARLSMPFDPVTLRSATLCETAGGQVIAMIKGAPEAVMQVCKFYMRPDGSLAELTLAQRTEFLSLNRQLAYENNLRVIGFAQKTMVAGDAGGPYENAAFVGWVCLLDPPKPGMVEAIRDLRRKGTEIIMITGDQKATAEITARELGIMRRNADEVWLKSDLEAWDEPTIPETVKVFARTKPEEKLAIVESLQRSGRIVAMVGDGVNDSPALQKSDVAVAMGLQGSQAAKDSADIILLNDRLEGVMFAISESHALRGKIQSCIRYLLSCNLGLILFVAAASLGGLDTPVNVVQMLWLNLLIVTIPAMVLAVEPARETLAPLPAETDEDEQWRYKRKNDPAQTLPPTVPQSAEPLDGAHLFLVGYWGVLMMLATVGAYLLTILVLKQPPAVGGTVAFCTLAFCQTFNLFNIQALNAGEHRRNFMAELASTPITWVVCALVLGLQALAVYTPGVNTLLGTAPLPLITAGLPLLFGGAAVLVSLKTMKVP